MADGDGPKDQGGDQGDQPPKSDDQGADPGTQTRNVVPPTEVEYERWYREYRAGARSPTKLARIVRAGIHRVRHAVLFGWPDLKFPALKDRAETSAAAVAAAVQQVTTEAEVRAAETVARVIAGTWEDAARAQLAAAASTTEALGKLAERLAQAAAAATFVTYRRVPDRDPATKEIRRDGKGNVITVLKEHVSAFTVAAAAARLAVAAKDHAALSKALLSSIAPGEAAGVLVGPPAVVLYMPDNNTAPKRDAGRADESGT